VSAQWKYYQGCSVVASGPLFLDQWVEVRVDIDLNANLVRAFYGGIQMAPTTNYYAAVPAPRQRDRLRFRLSSFRRMVAILTRVHTTTACRSSKR
jgi:hypothetical protein